MKRVTLLTQAQGKDETKSAIETQAKREKRDLEKSLADAKYDVEVKKEELQERMSKGTPVDASVVTLHFEQLEKLETKVSNLEKFISEYYGS